MMRRFDLDLPRGHFCTFAQHDFHNLVPSPPHTHSFHEFFWVERGSAIHWWNGKRIPLKTGDLILVRADDNHSFSVEGEGISARIVNFAFFASIWRDFRRRYFDRETIFYADPECAARSFVLEPHQLGAMQAASRHLRAGSRRRLHVEGFLLAVLTLLDEGRSWNSQSGLAAPRWIVQSCERIRLDRSFAGGMPALARLAGRSPEHIAREFRRYLGRTPIEVINEARMSYAADRLATSDEQISEIALNCGLENLGHFYRLFRAHAGCTPRRYRLQQQAVLRPGRLRR